MNFNNNSENANLEEFSGVPQPTNKKTSAKKTAVVVLCVVVILAVVLTAVIIRMKATSHLGTYKCVSANMQHEEIVLKEDDKYTMTGESDGTYSVSEEKVVFNPANGDDRMTYLRSGDYLYSDRGWFEDDSPYFKQDLPKGKTVNQVLSFKSEDAVNTVAGMFFISLERRLELKENGTYTYKYIQNNTGNVKENTEKGTYKRTKNELQLVDENGNEYSMPIVENKVVYVQVFKKQK